MGAIFPDLLVPGWLLKPEQIRELVATVREVMDETQEDERSLKFIADAEALLAAHGDIVTVTSAGTFKTGKVN